jgi:uncharacterized membrane protein YphA (DoxX/SURF4 family)
MTEQDVHVQFMKLLFICGANFLVGGLVYLLLGIQKRWAAAAILSFITVCIVVALMTSAERSDAQIGIGIAILFVCFYISSYVGLLTSSAIKSLARGMGSRDS